MTDKTLDNYQSKELGLNPRSRTIFILCLNKEQRKMFRDTINQYHTYMTYKDTCNRRLNFLIYVDEKFVGIIGINSAILAMGERDKIIGWNKEQRLTNLVNVANIYRYCLINKKTNQTTSQILRAFVPVAKKEWFKRYGDKLVLLETLVKPPYKGESYLASNFKYVGMTKGVSFSKAPLASWKKEKGKRGELARKDPQKAIEKYAVGGKQYHITKSEPKLIFMHPLHRYWKRVLCK